MQKFLLGYLIFLNLAVLFVKNYRFILQVFFLMTIQCKGNAAKPKRLLRLRLQTKNSEPIVAIVDISDRQAKTEKESYEYKKEEEKLKIALASARATFAKDKSVDKITVVNREEVDLTNNNNISAKLSRLW